MRKQNKIPSKKGFTLIELITVMSIMAVLVLMATPRFLERTEKALEVNIRNNVLLVESKVAETLILDQGRIDSWMETPPDTLVDLETNKKLFDRRGEVNDKNPIRGTDYHLVPETFVKKEAQGSLDGAYYTNENGVVYYAKE